MFNPICYILLLILTQSGRILNGDLWVDYANAGLMTQLSFSFKLENPIDSNDYIKIALPFPLHSQLTPAVPAMEGLSSPSALTVTYQLMDDFANINPSFKYAQILTETIDSSNYFIRFYDTDRITLINIPSGQWYYLKFKVQSTQPLQYQKSNSILQIQIQTVSSVMSNAIVYDDNLGFNYFQLASTPPQTISLLATPLNFGSAGGYLLTSAAYDMYLDVSMNISSSHYDQNLLLRFIIDQSDTFIWTGSCLSIAKTSVPTIALLDPSLYTCTVNTNTNVMQVKLTPSALTLQTSYRFKVSVTNPPIVVKNVNILVRAIKQQSPVIIAFGKATNALSTNQIYVTYQEIFLGWGLRPDALLPFDARIYRGNTATPTYMPYNSLTLKFSISRNTSPNVQLKLMIDIPSQANAFVLQNGFTFNLPAFPNKIVQCIVEQVNSPTTRKIGCSGVGALSTNTVYYVGWKMFFPYDNYQSSIDCTSFATLTIYTCQPITNTDVAFVLGRSNDYLKYLKSSSNYNVIGRNASYIAYMKTFLSLKLVVLSNDFQQFLQYPESIFVTNRPKTYTNKPFNDVYVISQNLAFLTYISLFPDIYVAVRLKSTSDIIKGYDTYPLISKTTPKNTLTIKSANSQDWTDFTNSANPLISTSSTIPTTTPVKGLRTSASSQSLVFSLKGLFASVSSFSSVPATTITNNWGMIIMTNYKIAIPVSTTTVLTQASVSGLTISAQTYSTNTTYNQYTAITIRGTLSSQIQTIFNDITANRISFGVSPVVLNSYASIYPNDDNLDIMIATVDGIDGPLNRIVYNGFFMINGFSTFDVPLGTLNMQFINYQSTTPLDGSTVPTLLRIKGTISDTNVDSLSIFFDALTPFYQNYYSGDIFCYSTDGTPFCTYKQGSSQIQKYNYQSMARFEIPLTNPNTSFNIFIPVTFTAGQTATNFYVGYQKYNAAKLRKQLVYIQDLRTISISGSATATGTYGPIVSTNKVGQTVTNLKLSAVYSAGITANSGTNIGAAFSYFSEWDFFGSSTITGWSGSPTCYVLNYIYYYTNYNLYLSGTAFSSSYKKMTGIVCPADSAVTTTALQLTISSSQLPSKWGRIIPGNGAYSSNTGLIKDLKINANMISASQVATTIVPPVTGRNLAKAIGIWYITLPVALEANAQINIIGNNSLNIPYTPSGTCAIFIGSVKTTVGCIFTAAPTNIQYTLTINQEGLLPKGTVMSIVQYGHYTSAAVGSNTVVLITCYSLVNTNSPSTNDIIFTATATILWQQSGSYLGATTLTLSNFTKLNLNKATYSQFSFYFNLISKGLYLTNRVRVDLGQLAIDNSASTVSPTCIVLDPITYAFSHDWASIDTSQGLSSLQLWPQVNLVGNNLTYVVKCYNFITTSSPTPIAISGKIANLTSDLTGDISSSANIIPMSLTYTNSQTSQVSLSKKFTIPSSSIEMTFTIVSPGITIDSIMYIGFPSYYPNGLGPDIKCLTDSQIYCTISNRYLTVKYLGNYALGTTFSLIVVGITQTINYNSGTFFYLIDNDDNPIQVVSSGTFIDSVSSTVLVIQNFPAFSVYSMTQSSSYLREEGVTLTIDFFLPTTLTSVSTNQYLYLIFPPIYYDILRFISPSCVLNIKGNTLKNYINTCSVTGMRLKMAFLDDISLGSTYTLTINGLINPTNPSANVYKYSLEISNTNADSIIAKSYSPHCNFIMPIFTLNPIRYSLNYYTSVGLVNSITTFANIQSQQVYISSGANLSASSYSRNVYLQVVNTLYSIPSKIDLWAGSNPFTIRMSSLTAGVNYVYFTKTGDGSYYSNLPPLVLISNRNYFTALSFKELSFNLPIGAVGTNYNLVINLIKSLYPMSQVSMTVTLSSTVGLSLSRNPTTISFYPQQTSATIPLTVNDATLWVNGATTNMIITPSDSNTYASSASITLIASPSTTNNPTTTLLSSSAGLKSYVFSIGCSEYGSILYHISRTFSYNSTACVLTPQLILYWSQQSSIDGLRVTETYYKCLDIIGTVNIISPSTPQLLTISNLLASTKYTMRAFCQTQQGVSSPIQQLAFSTTNNGGVITKIDFLFNSVLTTAQKIKLSCALALYFKVDYYKVSTWDGYYCSELLSRRLLTQQRFLQTSTYRTAVFFGTNNNLNSDTSNVLINSQSLLTNLKNQINSNVVGLPTLLSYSASAISYVGNNDLSSTPYIDIGPNYLYIKGLTMNNNGLIYIIAGQSSLWTTSPTIAQIKQGSGPNGLPPSYYRVLSYRTNEAKSGSMAWTNMPQKTFKLFILPSDDNPFDTASFASIKQYTVTYEVPSWNYHLEIILIVILMLMI